MAAGQQWSAITGRPDAHRIDTRLAIPLGDERHCVEDQPAMRVGDVERQATISKPVRGAVHPVALDRCRDHSWRFARGRIADQPHWLPHCRSLTPTQRRHLARDAAERCVAKTGIGPRVRTAVRTSRWDVLPLPLEALTRPVKRTLLFYH